MQTTQRELETAEGSSCSHLAVPPVRLAFFIFPACGNDAGGGSDTVQLSSNNE
jgi:hypothetical protein